MSTNLSAKCYQQNKERLYKTLMKDITTFSRKKKFFFCAYVQKVLSQQTKNVKRNINV